VPKEVRDYVKGFYGQPPDSIDEEVKRLIIGDEEPITYRSADLLEPVLDKIPEEVKPYIESEDDMLTYALFPAVALEFFKKRKARREEAKTGVPKEKLAELEKVAAISAAIVVHLAEQGGVKALTLQRFRREVSPWVLAWRKILAEHDV